MAHFTYNKEVVSKQSSKNKEAHSKLLYNNSMGLSNNFCVNKNKIDIYFTS